MGLRRRNQEQLRIDRKFSNKDRDRHCDFFQRSTGGFCPSFARFINLVAHDPNLLRIKYECLIWVLGTGNNSLNSMQVYYRLKYKTKPDISMTRGLPVDEGKKVKFIHGRDIDRIWHISETECCCFFFFHLSL